MRIFHAILLTLKKLLSSLQLDINYKMVKKVLIYILAFVIFLSSASPVMAESVSRGSSESIQKSLTPTSISTPAAASISTLTNTANPVTEPTDIDQPSAIEQSITSTPVQPNPSSDTTRNDFPPADNSTDPQITPPDTEIDTTTQQNILENTPSELTPTPSPDPLVSGILKPKENLKPIGNTFKIEADTATGALILEYPIEVPPGRNGLQPDLALVYNSQNTDNDNIFGYGWSINIPYIKRINKKGVDKLYSENFFNSSISGELEDITLTDGTHGNYGAKIENGDFLKYEYKNDNSWEVSDKSGLIYKFGLTAQSRQDDPNDNTKVFKWVLEEIRDTNDNFIKYEYLKEDGQIYPAKIKYTGNGNADGLFTIKFYIKGKEDENVSYKTGFKVETNYIIQVIEKDYNDNLIQRYDLSYITGDNNTRTLLEKIQEVAYEESTQIFTTLPADSFEYEKNDDDWSLKSSYTIPVNLWNGYNEASGARFADVNGDALPDIIYASKNNDHKIYINKGTETGWEYNSNYYFPVSFVDKYGTDLGIRLADVNGDMLVDILEASYDENSTYLNNGSGWSLDQNYSIPVDFVDKYNGDLGTRIAEVNGDGFPDLIQSDNGKNAVYLNKVNSPGWEYAGSYYVPEKFTYAGTALADINGDNLVDILYSRENSYKAVYINNGKDWLYDGQYNIPVYIATKDGGDNGVRIEDANGDGLVDIFYARDDDFDNRKVFINKNDNTGWFENNSYSIPKPFIVYSGTEDNGVRLEDINGDGLVDFVYRNDSAPISSGDPANINNRVYAHSGDSPDLLRFFYSDKGGKIQINYSTTAEYKDSSNKLLNPKMPILVETVLDIFWFHNQTATPKTVSYEYINGQYYYKDSLNRKFAGFGIISQSDSFNNLTKNHYHQGNTSDPANGEYNDAPSKIGLTYLIEKLDANNNLYAKLFNRWENTALGNEREFIKLTQTIESAFDGNNGAKSKAEKYSYNDSNGNLTQQTLMGEVQASTSGEITQDIGNDKLTTDLTYANDNSSKITGFPSQETIKDQSGAKIKETKYYYDNSGLGSVSKGNLTKKEFWKSGSNYINSTKTYNGYGLVTQEADPLGNITAYEYDSYNLYPIKTTNALNQSESYTYDYSSGGVSQYTDQNGSKFENIYDVFDRIKEEKQPDQANPTTSITKTVYTYYDNVFPSYIVKKDKIDSQAGPINYTYFDGLGRVIQARQEIEDPSIFSVKDYKYDNNGLLQKESLPYISSGSSKTSETANDNLYIKYTYDPLNRTKTIQNALGTETYTYDDWKTTIKDEENNQKDFFTDAYGNLTKVVEYNENSSYTTNYQYNGLNNLTKITDALGNIQNFNYDNLGRRLSSEDLHTANDATFGTHTYSYDDASNLTSETDQNGQTINYNYDKLSRPIIKNYTGQNGDEVTYSYDNCTYGIGQLCKVTNLTNGTNTVITQYGYTPLGFTSSKKRTIDGKDYLTQFSYDYLGNPLSITYPDSSVTTYTHNTEGKIKSVKHQNNEIIKNITYAATGAPEEIKNANGTTEKNTFDQTKLYRLTNKSTTATQSIQNISYTYDKVGNVKQVVDSSNPTIGKTANYQYDNLYRLKSATITNAGNGQNYTHTFQYNALGNLTSKTGQGNYSYAGNLGTSYATPHAVTGIGTTNFSYDKNGNLLSDGKQTYKWDYKNRLIEGSATGLATKYLYDHSGERVKKSDGKNWTIYVNNFYEIRNDKIVKHIYADDDEVAAVEVTPGGETQPPPPTPPTTPTEVIYEDAEDGDTLGWEAYGTYAKVTNSYENATQGQVIVLSSSTPAYAFKLKNEDGTLWNNSTEKVFSWDMNYKNDIYLDLILDTNKGEKHLIYTTTPYNNYSTNGLYIYVSLDPVLKDEKWHTITRNLQTEVSSIQPDTVINMVKYLSVLSTGKLDNIKLSSPLPTPDKTVYEDAEDGDTLGWKGYVPGSKVTNSYENETQGKVIILSGTTTSGGFELKNEDGTLWNNSTQKIFSWDMNYKNDIFLKLTLDTNKGSKSLIYTTIPYNNKPDSAYIYIVLDPTLKDSKWHTVTRDLQADISSIQPDTTINTIKYMQVWYIGKLDNIKLSSPLPVIPPDVPATFIEVVYEDAEDGNTLGWFTSKNNGSKVQNLYDDTKQSKIISLTGPDKYDSFTFKKEDGKQWDDSQHKIFSFDINTTTEPIFITLQITTSNNIKKIQYSPITTPGLNGDTIYVKLDTSIKDGKWHTIVRDVSADLATVKPDTTLQTIHMMYVNGHGKLDNIKLMTPASGGTSQTGTQTIYHHTDHLSGTSIETDANGKVIEMTDYYPFGEIRIDQSLDSNGTATPTGYKNPYKFTGKELDADIGLYYYGARYYNPAIGRFVSMDPWEGDLKDPQSLNKYSYVRNNPLRYVDPTGELFETIVDLALTTYDGLKTAKNTFESAVDSMGLLWNLYVEKNYEAAADYANSYDNNIGELKAAATDLTVDAGATLIPFVPAGLSKVTKAADKINDAKKSTGKVKELEMMQPSVSTKFKHGNMAGKSVKDVIDDLKTGKINPKDVPIGYVGIDGKNVVINNRSFSAIKEAGVKPKVNDLSLFKDAYNQGKKLMKQSKGKVFDKLNFK